MDAGLKDGLQQALGQFELYREGDYDGVKAVHDIAVEDGSSWTLNLALLYLVGKCFPAYYATLKTTMPMAAVLRETIRHLATMDE